MPTSLCEYGVNICKSLQVAQAAKSRQLQRMLPSVPNGAKTITTMSATSLQLRLESARCGRMDVGAWIPHERRVTTRPNAGKAEALITTAGLVELLESALFS